VHVVYKNCSECQNKKQFAYTTRVLVGLSSDLWDF
jgi:hypothetical protein